jgi:hypothetical protein
MATRLTVVAAIITSILSSSPSIAGSDDELGKLGDKMSGAFKCYTYAGTFHDLKEQQRLFQIGLKAARDFVEGMKSRNDTPLSELQTYMPGASTDFVVGQMYDMQEKMADNEIRSGGQRMNLSEEETQAKVIYQQNNCSLIQ